MAAQLLLPGRKLPASTPPCANPRHVLLASANIVPPITPTPAHTRQSVYQCRGRAEADPQASSATIRTENIFFIVTPYVLRILTSFHHVETPFGSICFS